jgi:Ca2+-binding RTX toxin-like protein
MRRRGIVALAGLCLAWGALPAAATTPTPCLGRAATIVGTAGDDELSGTDGIDVIAALDGDDVVRAGSDEDYVCGGRGGDVIRGGSEPDFLWGGGGHDKLYGQLDGFSGDILAGGRGNDLLDGGTEPHSERDLVAYSHYANWFPSSGPVVVDLPRGVATGNGRDRLVGFEEVAGSNHSDVLVTGSQGGGDAQWASRGVYGAGGDDHISVRSGSDYVGGGDGDDVIFLLSSGGEIGIFPGEGDDIVHGTASNDNLFVDRDSGSDTVKGHEGDDEIDVTDDVQGNDLAVGGTGEDWCKADPEDQLLSCQVTLIASSAGSGSRRLER